MLKQISLIAAILFVTSSALAFISGTHVFKSSSNPTMTAANTSYVQNLNPPTNPPIASQCTHTVTNVAYSWNIDVCLPGIQNPVTGVVTPGACSPSSTVAGLEVMFCKAPPSGTPWICTNVTGAKTGNVSLWNNQTYSQPWKFKYVYTVWGSWPGSGIQLKVKEATATTSFWVP